MFSRPKSSSLTKSSAEDKVFLIGIGASAGGLEALQAFFRALPRAEIDMAFVLVQHLAPQYNSMMVELLTRVTDVPIVLVTEDKKIEPHTIYQIAPGSHIEIDDGWVRFRKVTKRHKGDPNSAVNVMMCSMANSCGALCAGVILSGTGSDGRAGIVRIKEKGGLAYVQDPETAKFDGMPLEAIGTGLVDCVGSPQKIAVEIVRVARKIIQQLDFPSLSKGEAVAEMLRVLREMFHVNFEEYKLSTVSRRIQNRMNVVGFDTVEEYYQELCSNADEAAALYNNILIGVTAFMRDGAYWRVIYENVIPCMVTAAVKEKRSIRVWSAGCSTGEESYSIAILLHEYMAASGVNVEYKVYATDIDEKALQCASRGIFPEEVLSDDFKAKYFFPVRGGFQVSRALRSHMLVTKHNMATDPPFKDMDLIICRNVLIYFGSSLQDRVLDAFDFGLRPGGFLFLGSSETVDHSDSRFSVLDSRARVFVKHKGHSEDSSSTAGGENSGGGYEYPDSVINNEMGISAKVTTDATTELTGSSGRRPVVPPVPNKVHIPPELVEILCFKFNLPCALMDRNKDVLHTFGDFRDFIAPNCDLTLKVAALFRRELSVPIWIALPKALEMGRTVMYKNILLVDHNGGDTTHVVLNATPSAGEGDPDACSVKTFIDIVVCPLEKYSHSEPVAAVFFLRSNSWIPGAAVGDGVGFHTLSGAVFDGDRTQLNVDARERILELERTLEATQRSLRNAVVQLETSNEELQSTNEELVASNEELQSTNEELQSVNEELYTVNSEHGVRIEELQQTNNDMSNLVNATGIPTVFLDSEFLVRKFTALMKNIMTIRPGDIGRPFEEILFHEPGLPMAWIKSDLKKCLRDGLSIRHLIKTTLDGSSYNYLMTIRRNTADSSSESDCSNELIPNHTLRPVPLSAQARQFGVVITFTGVANAEVETVPLRNSLGNNIGNPVLLLDQSGKVCDANDLALKLFGFPSVPDITGVPSSSLYQEQEMANKASKQQGQCLCGKRAFMYTQVPRGEETMVFFFELA